MIPHMTLEERINAATFRLLERQTKIYTEDVEAAVERTLGKEVYTALTKSEQYPITILLPMAGLKWFKMPYECHKIGATQEDCILIRDALNWLEIGKHFSKRS